MNIFFIDDDYSINRFHEIILEKTANLHKANLQFFQDPLNALNVLKNTIPSEYPKIIFLDINMPKINGWDFLETYQTEKFPETNIIILTTSRDPDYEEKAAAFELVKDYQTKPIDASYFENTITAALSKKCLKESFS